MTTLPDDDYNECEEGGRMMMMMMMMMIVYGGRGKEVWGI